METIIAPTKVLSGGEFIVKETNPSDIYVPEEMDEEQTMVRDMTRDFVLASKTAMQQLDQQAPLMEEAGSLGLLGAHIPEAFGGMGLDVPTNTYISEELGAHAGSFGTTFAAHTGIGMLPILYFGTETQKNHYLPKMASGEWKGAYCLTEPSSGSDALAAKTRADLSSDEKNYLISGQKMWISNAGFADIFIVFAQVEGTRFTGFIVEADRPGISLGAEEKKLGIKGSSTRQVFFENVEVPIENVLGEVGRGHLIAFNSLNTGRFKLGNMCMGGAKSNCSTSIKYANERKQFKQPISNFGAIQAKLAEQATRTYAVESMVYRVAGMIEQHKQDLVVTGEDVSQAKLKAAEELAIECAIVKVLGSEVLNYVVDETVQIHGGYGFSEEYPAARAYRDQRIGRIYEGTNEINRMLIINMLFKRVMAGKIDLVGPAWEVQKELTTAPATEEFTGAYAQEFSALANFKKMALMVLGAAAKQQMDGKLDLKEEQEILMDAADMLIEIHSAESTLLRIVKCDTLEQPATPEVYCALLQSLFYQSNARLAKSATDALGSFLEGDLLQSLLGGVQRFASYPVISLKSARRTIAQHLIAKNDWSL